MNIYLKGYSFGNMMAIVSRCPKSCRALMERGVDLMFIADDCIVFQPGNKILSLEGTNRERINKLCDYDIVEISDSGILYRAFANNEADSTVFLGGRCNSNCIMCPAGDTERRKGFSYSRETLLKYIDYLPYNLEYIVMTGGEPTMQTALFLEALDRVREKFPYTQVLLLTNGRSLSDRWLCDEVKSRHPQNFRIAIPVHGSTPALHDYITRARGSFEQTMLGLQRLMDSDIKIEIRIVVTKTNCEDLLNIAKLITTNFHRVFCVNFVSLEARGNCALNFDEVYIDHRQSFLCSKPAIEHLIAHGYDVGLYNYPLCAVDRDFWPIAAKSISGYKNVYHPDCDLCTVKSICGGFFTATMRIAKPEVHPFLIKETTND